MRKGGHWLRGVRKKPGNKRKPLQVEEVPEKLRQFMDFKDQQLIEDEISARRRWSVKVTCPKCAEVRWVPYSHIREACKRHGWTAICWRCFHLTTSKYRRRRTGPWFPSIGLMTKPDQDGYIRRPFLSYQSNDERQIVRPMVRPDGTVFEHRAIVALALGRPLRPDELVHHKNGDRADNRLENLELVDNHKREICPRCGWRMGDLVVEK